MMSCVTQILSLPWWHAQSQSVGQAMETVDSCSINNPWG